MVPQARCPKCGTRYYGWALRSPRNPMCEKCGLGLEISEEGGRAFVGYSPLTAEEHKLNIPGKVSHPEGAKDE
jgi:hypothetical protein